jgi:hypothetical protein
MFLSLTALPWLAVPVAPAGDARADATRLLVREIERLIDLAVRDWQSSPDGAAWSPYRLRSRSALMTPAVDKLTLEDIVSLDAYVASLEP